MYVSEKGGLAERVQLIDEDSVGGVGSVESCLQCPTIVYMMPQEDKGLAIWQVQADWQY